MIKTLLQISLVCASVSPAASGDALDNLDAVQLDGPLGARLDRMVRAHVAETDPDYITRPFMEKTESRGGWQTEFWGKWMHSAVPYAWYEGMDPGRRDERLCAHIERGIDRILASQETNGYIGNYPDALRCGEGWDVWGMKYTLMGLLHYVDLAARPACGIAPERAESVLDAAKRLCDYVIAEIGPGGKRRCELWQTGNWSGYASSSILEPVMWLYNRTKEKKYLDFATYIVEGMTRPEKGPRLLDLAEKGVSVADRNDPECSIAAGWGVFAKHGRTKAYEMISCYQGILEYTAATGRKDLFDAAVRTAEDIVTEEVTLAGSCASCELWIHGAKKQYLPYVRLQETCVTTTWMRFCEKLLAETDDPKWADEMERTFYNAYLGAMKADGSEFAGYTPLSGYRWHGQHQCDMHTDCCTSNGPRGFLCFLRALCRSDGRTATFNFYASARVKGFDMYALYPRENTARIVSRTEGPLAVRLRIPAWSAATRVAVNGAEQSGVKAGSYFCLSRDWKLGDIVEIVFDMPVVAHKLDHAIAFTRGPVLLARDSRFADGDLAEPLRGGIKDGQKMAGFAAVRVPSDDVWMAFSAVLPLGSHHENPEGAHHAAVMFCDYASAGNGWRPGNYYRTWFPEEYSQFE